MKKTLPFLIVFAALATTAEGQHVKSVSDQQTVATKPSASDKSRDLKALDATDKLDKMLSLSKEQREKIMTINKHLVELENQMKASSKSQEEYQKELTSVRIQLLSSVLTADQMHKLRQEMVK